MEAAAPFVVEGIFFEDLLAQAVESPTDQQAQEALRLHVQDVIEQGDLARAMRYAMVVGATACKHPHLKSLANSLGEQFFFTPEDKGGDSETDDDDDDEDDD